jgi:hypothetical protein
VSARLRPANSIVGYALTGGDAHVATRSVFDGLDWRFAGARVKGSPHTLYELLNHMIFWQEGRRRVPGRGVTANARACGGRLAWPVSPSHTRRMDIGSPAISGWSHPTRACRPTSWLDAKGAKQEPIGHACGGRRAQQLSRRTGGAASPVATQVATPVWWTYLVRQHEGKTRRNGS